MEITEGEEAKMFECCICGLHEKYDQFGSDPSFTKPIKFKEEVFVMRDPFSPPNQTVSTNFLLLGGICCLCRQPVCVDQSACSIFYGGRYCVECITPMQSQFPAEVQKEIALLVSGYHANKSKDESGSDASGQKT